MNRRTFLKASGEASIGATVVAVTVGFGVPVAQATKRVQTETPDAGGYIRPYGHCLTLPPQEWMMNGDWVMQQTLDLLQPDRWHSWGDWPETDYPGRIPMVFATRYFDPDRVRRRMQTKSGEVWMPTNEPEMPLQANESPEAIADLVCALIDIGQHSGAKWQWGSPAVTLTTEHGGLEWLKTWTEIMRQIKGIAKPFTWFIHPYGSSSVSKLHASMDAWWERYYKDNKGQGAPVVISEYCAEDASPDVQADVMLEVNKMMRSGVIKGEFWFAAYKSSVMEERRRPLIPWLHYPLCLLDHATRTVRLTELGRYWKELQAPLSQDRLRRT